MSLHLADEPISFVKQYRFMGVLLARKLTWRPYIAQPKKKTQKDTRLLASVVAGHMWGDKCEGLKLLYLTIVLRPKLEYVGFFFTTAAATHLIKLARI